MLKIGLIGLGNMGKGVCHRLVEAGYPMTIFDLSQEAMDRFAGQAAPAASPDEVFAHSDVVFLSLPSSQAVERVVEGFLKLSPQGKTVVDLSTSDPISTRRLYTALGERGCSLLDAPLSAGPQAAWEGTMEILVAGDRAAAERLDDVFRSFCARWDYVGRSGSAHTLKLAKNWAGLLQALLYAQLYPVMEQLGIPAGELYQILDTPTLSNWIFRFYGKKFVARDYPLDFSLALGRKDILYMRSLCQTAGVPAYMLDGAVRLCEDTLAWAEERQLGTVDLSYVCEWLHAGAPEQKSRREKAGSIGETI